MDTAVPSCVVACVTMVILFGTCSGQAQRGCTGPSSDVACEHDNLQLQCPSGSTLNIVDANYGRTAPYSDVCHPSTRGIKAWREDLTCGSSSSTSSVSATCEGRQTCSVPASNGKFGDPCGGTYKYLNVSFFCVPDCSDGQYGQGCTHSCSAHCTDVCDKLCGHCTCHPGYQPPLCITPCDDGQFGQNCPERCGQGCGDVCDKVTGTCSCTPGWKPPLCQQECDDGRYGQDCAFTCSAHCADVCDKQSGNCTCKPGYLPPLCLHYPTTTVSLSLDGVQQDLTVSEHQTLTFQCQESDGDPAPTVSLLRLDNSTELSTGQSSLSHSAVVNCQDSGTYVCTADNGLGPEATSVARNLFVQCSPRGIQDMGEVHFLNDPVSVAFEVTAYPVPHSLTFTYLGASTTCCACNTQVLDTEIRLTGSCEAKPGVAYLSTCTVTVSNVTTATAAGFYTVTVSNTQGSAQLRLKVLYDQVSPQGTASKATDQAPDDCSFYPIVAFGFGVAFAVSLINNVVLVVWMWRRRWILPCAGTAAAAVKHQPTKGAFASVETDQKFAAEKLAHTAPPGPYDSLRWSDVGQTSVYSEIGGF